jgi:dolichol-phosphate mannosyltransferase
MIIQRILLKPQQYLCHNYEERWQEIVRFAFVGATGSVLNLAILYSLTNYCFMWYMAAAIISIEISIWWNFYLNTKITFNYRFRRSSDLFAAALKYHFSSLVGFIINIMTLFALTEFLKIYFLLSELAAIILAFGINYLISAKYVWHKK